MKATGVMIRQQCSRFDTESYRRSTMMVNFTVGNAAIRSANSYNIRAVRLLNQLELTLSSIMHEGGISTWIDSSRYGLSLTSVG